jgi:Protein kinase domain
MNDDETSPTLILSPPPQDRSGRAAGAALPWFGGAMRDDASLPEAAPAKLATVPATRHPGVVAGRLRDEGEIARGGMGSIHRLYDTDLRRRIALKVIDPGLAADPHHARRFVNEARIMGALDHPNIVPVHDLTADAGGHASYTMKLVDGRKLAELIDAQASKRDLELILQSLARVCDALAFAHNRGIVHRDLKPDNIMVGSTVRSTSWTGAARS